MEWNIGKADIIVFLKVELSKSRESLVWTPAKAGQVLEFLNLALFICVHFTPTMTILIFRARSPGYFCTHSKKNKLKQY